MSGSKRPRLCMIGKLVVVAVYQAERKQDANAKRARQAEQDYYASIGEWSPADELPDPDEVQGQGD